MHIVYKNDFVLYVLSSALRVFSVEALALINKKLPEEHINIDNIVETQGELVIQQANAVNVFWRKT